MDNSNEYLASPWRFNNGDNKDFYKDRKSKESNYNYKKSENIFNIENTRKARDQCVDVTPRTKINSKIMKLWESLFIKYVSYDSLKIPDTIISEIQLQSILNKDQEFINEKVIKLVFGRENISYEEQILLNISVNKIINDSNKLLKECFDFSSLQQILETELNDLQNCIIVTSDDDISEVGMIIHIHNNKLTDPVDGAIFIDVNSGIDSVSNTRTVLVFQHDQYEDFVLAAVLILKKYNPEVVSLMFSKMKEILGTFSEVSTNFDEVFIDGIEIYKKNNQLDLYVCDEIFIIDTKDILLITDYANSIFKWEEPSSEQNKDKIREDQYEFVNLINKISTRVDNLWSKYEAIIKFSQSFPKSNIEKYGEWKINHKTELNNTFSEVIKILVQPIQISNESLQNLICDVISIGNKWLINAFCIQIEEFKSFQNSDSDKIEDKDEKLIYAALKDYYPQTAYKIIKNYLLSKTWTVEIPNNIKLNADYLPPIIVKSHSIEENNSKEISFNENKLREKTFSIDPKTLIWSWNKIDPWNVACKHKIAYLVQGLKLEPAMLFASQVIIRDSFKIKNESRLKSIYIQMLKEYKKKNLSKIDSNLIKLNEAVKNHLKAKKLMKDKFAENCKSIETQKLSLKSTISHDKSNILEITEVDRKPKDIHNIKEAKTGEIEKKTENSKVNDVVPKIQEENKVNHANPTINILKTKGDCSLLNISEKSSKLNESFEKTYEGSPANKVKNRESILDKLNDITNRSPTTLNKEKIFEKIKRNANYKPVELMQKPQVSNALDLLEKLDEIIDQPIVPPSLIVKPFKKAKKSGKKHTKKVAKRG